MKKRLVALLLMAVTVSITTSAFMQQGKTELRSQIAQKWVIYSNEEIQFIRNVVTPAGSTPVRLELYQDLIAHENEKTFLYDCILDLSRENQFSLTTTYNRGTPEYSNQSSMSGQWELHGNQLTLSCKVLTFNDGKSSESVNQDLDTRIPISIENNDLILNGKQSPEVETDNVSHGEGIFWLFGWLKSQTSPQELTLILFSLIPLGGLSLFKGLKNLRKLFFGKVILNMPYNDRESEFTITEVGHYALWHGGKIFSITPVNEYKPQITNIRREENVTLHRSYAGIYSNKFKTGRALRFFFSVKETGQYRLEVIPGNSLNPVENLLLGGIKPNSKSAIDQYYLEIRQSLVLWKVLLSIPLLITGLFLIIGGLVTGIFSIQ